MTFQEFNEGVARSRFAYHNPRATFLPQQPSTTNVELLRDRMVASKSSDRHVKARIRCRDRTELQQAIRETLRAYK